MPLRRTRSHNRWHDLWWEILAGLLVVAAICWLAWYEPQDGRIARLAFSGWTLWGLTVATAAVLVAQFYWSLRRSRVFWCIAAAFLVVFAGSAGVWVAIGGLGLRWTLWLGPIFGVEFIPFAYLVYLKFQVLPNRRV
jgi:hypothetical protein